MEPFDASLLTAIKLFQTVKMTRIRRQTIIASNGFTIPVKWMLKRNKSSRLRVKVSFRPASVGVLRAAAGERSYRVRLVTHLTDLHKPKRSSSARQSLPIFCHMMINNAAVRGSRDPSLLRGLTQASRAVEMVIMK